MPPSGRVLFGQMDEVVFGKPAAEAIAAQVHRLGTTRVFLMVSNSLNRNTDEIDKIRRALGNRCAGTFDHMPAHTPRAAVIEATEAARAAHADLIVTIGGGSITDGGKAVQMCLANDIRSPEAIDKLRPVKGADGIVGPPPMNPPMVRQISVPTTLSGRRFQRLGGGHRRAHESQGAAAPSAHHAERGRARSGDHAAYAGMALALDRDSCGRSLRRRRLSNEAHVFGDAQALKGLALLASGLPRVKAEPKDLAARLDCQLGAWLSMGPLSSGVPMGASHGIGYVLGAEFGVPHGHTSCIMLPAVMRWNKPANGDRQPLISTAMSQAGSDAGDVLDSLIRGLGMPRSLGAVKIGRDNFQRIAVLAKATPWVPRNPRPIDAPDQVREILEFAS